jgi:DNA helicase-2/ATP-dependent DNA helicase PcrA
MANPHILDGYLSPKLDLNRQDWIRRERLPQLVQSAAEAFIRTAKDKELDSKQAHEQMDALPVPLPLFKMGAEIYGSYQRSLAYRGAVDFDDLIRLALGAIKSDPAFLARLQHKWPYILEDEAQDSSQLQEKILRTLTGKSGNWVRVGDPNQAIFESFTTADPSYLREFIRICDHNQELPQSGRSTYSIIDLANYLIDWSKNGHPIEDVRDALDLPYIEPVSPGDHQPNPEDNPKEIHFADTIYDSNGELKAVADSVAHWVALHPEETVAVLVPRHNRGIALAEELKTRKIQYNESLLRSTTSTRRSAGAITHVLRYLDDPENAGRLSNLYLVYRRDDQEDPEIWATVKETVELLKNCTRVEDFVYPRPGQDWLDQIALPNIDPVMYEDLVTFREYVRRWQGTVLLPVDQIVLTLAQDIFQEPSELALAHKLSALLRQVQNNNPYWRLKELAGELMTIAKNERRFLGFSPEDTGFNPDHYKGQVVISTMHKAKGLEWDRVYLMSVNNYGFPSGKPEDRYIPEKWFIRGNPNLGDLDGQNNHLNLEAETLAQLEAATQPDIFEWYQEGEWTYEARMDYIRERLRLFYVGITRARKELVVTWNTGRRGNLSMSVPFEELSVYWEDQMLQTSEGKG